jgi:hypothetical protein
MANRREYLIRETFELERDYHYTKFRAHHWDDPRIVEKCPEPALREKMLRGFWNQDAETRYPEYRKAVAKLSTAELETTREQWIETLDAIGCLQWREACAEAAQRAANDNGKGHER